MNSDIILKNNLEKMFIKKEVDINNPAVLASLISAVSGMASASDFAIDSEETRDELLDLYGQNENEELKSMSYLNSNFVKLNIGYSVQFEDYDSARTCYMADKQNYDRLYTGIANRSLQHERATGGKTL